MTAAQRRRRRRAPTVLEFQADRARAIAASAMLLSAGEHSASCQVTHPEVPHDLWALNDGARRLGVAPSVPGCHWPDCRANGCTLDRCLARAGREDLAAGEVWPDPVLRAGALERLEEDLR